MSRRPAAAVALAVLGAVAASVVGGACGVGTDGAPRALAVSTTTSTTAPGPTVGGTDSVVYQVREGSLVPVLRSVPDESLGTVLDALVQPPTADEGTVGISTAIPTGTEVLGIVSEGDVVRIDLSDAFDDVVGPSRQLAIGQLVLTATSSPTITRLRFSVDGEPVTVASPTRGDTTVVTECDFEELLPAPDRVAEALEPEALARLAERREELDRTCPPRPGDG